MWSHFAVAYCRRPLSHSHPKTSRSSQAGDQRGAAPVPCRSQHACVPQHATQPRLLLSRRQTALGLFGLWPRTRLPQLGPPFRAGSQHSARVSYVPGGRALCATVAGLWGGLLCGHRCTNARLCAMWTCVFGEVGKVLGGDTSAPWHPRLPRRLPLLCHPAQPYSGLFQVNLPGPGGLSWRVLLWQRGLNRNANTLWNLQLFCAFFCSCKPAVERFWLYTVDSAQQRAIADCSGRLVAVWMSGAHRTTGAWLLQNEIMFQLSCLPTTLNKVPPLSCFNPQWLLVFHQRDTELRLLKEWIAFTCESAVV